MDSITRRASEEKIRADDDSFGGDGLVTEDRRVYFVAKRALDLMLGSVLVVLLFPLILLIAGVIRLDSSGPVLFAQERVGASRRLRDRELDWEHVTFRCFKFRTMEVNADPAMHRAYLEALIKNDHAGLGN